MIAPAQNGEYYCPTPRVDGVNSPDSPYHGNPHCLGGRAPRTCPRAPATPNASAGQSLPFNLPGSTAELDFVRSILGYQTGTDPAEVSDLPPRRWRPCCAERR